MKAHCHTPDGKLSQPYFLYYARILDETCHSNYSEHTDCTTIFFAREVDAHAFLELMKEFPCDETVWRFRKNVYMHPHETPSPV